MLLLYVWTYAQQGWTGAKRLYESLYSPFADMNLWIEFIIYCINIIAC